MQKGKQKLDAEPKRYSHKLLTRFTAINKKTSGVNWIFYLEAEEENTASFTQESQAQAHLTMRRNWQSQIEEATLKQLNCTLLEYNRRLRSCSRS